jgi:hypothetical protein
VPYIRLIGEDEATGELADEYAAARGRAGKVFNIIKAISLRPGVLRAMMGLPGGHVRVIRSIVVKTGCPGVSGDRPGRCELSGHWR